MTTVLQNIKNIRKAKGVSQESIAYDLGIDYSTYGKIERGQIALTIDRLEKIAEILDVSVRGGYGNMIDLKVNGEVLRFAHLNKMFVKS